MATLHHISSMAEHEHAHERERDEFFFRSWVWWTALPPLVITLIMIGVLLAFGAGQKAFILAIFWSPVFLFVFMLLSVFLATIAESVQFGPQLGPHCEPRIESANGLNSQERRRRV